MISTFKKSGAKIHHYVTIICSNGLTVEGYLSNNNRCALIDIICDKQNFIELVTVNEESIIVGKAHIVQMFESTPPPDAYSRALQLFGLREDANYADAKSAYVRMSKRYDAGLLEEMAADAETLEEAKRMTAELKTAFAMIHKKLSAEAAAPEE